MMSETKKKLSELLSFAKANGLAEMVWQENGVKIAFSRNIAVASAPKPAVAINSSSDVIAEPVDTNEIIKSPLVGTFRRSVSKDRPPLIMEGGKVKPGDRVGLVHCMGIPNDVVSFCSGKIVELLVKDGQTVEYGQPLMVVAPADVMGASEN
jgi:acetyl-CoA carboxylase biotin carboxyl carrier protein